MKLRILFLIPVFVFPVFSQTLEKDMEAITKALNDATSATISVAVNYSKSKGDAPVYTSVASLRKEKEMSVSVIDRTEIFTTKQYTAIVDHDSRFVRIITAKNLKEQKNPMADINPDKLMKLLKSTSEEEVYETVKTRDENGLRTYKVTGKGEITEMTISLDIANSAITEITLLYSKDSPYQGAYLELDYKKFIINGEEKISESDYFLRKSKSIVLSPRLSGYTLSTDL